MPQTHRDAEAFITIYTHSTARQVVAQVSWRAPGRANFELNRGTLPQDRLLQSSKHRSCKTSGVPAGDPAVIESFWIATGLWTTDCRHRARLIQAALLLRHRVDSVDDRDSA